MEKDKLENLLIDYIDGKLNEADKQVIEQELVRNAEAYKLYEQLKELVRVMDRPAELEPGKEVKLSFEQFLQQEIAHQPKVRSVFFQPMFYRVAASVSLLILAGVVGFWIYKDQQHEQELAVIRHEVEATKQMMLAMMNNEQSASQRITGVSVAYQLEKADDEIVQVLVKTMNEDPNTNVRMAALEALSKFHTDPNVRKALIQSLSIQKDPVVQIALIQLMVTMKEKGVVKDLERMTKDKSTMKAVKDEAYSGILKLS
jgi:hypothetical protein